ncbi:hypothetical protein D3C86_1536090 [compost metagenome]
MQVLRVALLDQERFAHAIRRIRECHLLATSGRDIHAGRDDVEALGGKAGDQRTELGQHTFHFIDAHALEHDARDLHGFTRDLGFLAVHIRERRLVGVPDAYLAGGFGGFKRAGAGCRCAARGGRRLVGTGIGAGGQDAQAQRQQQSSGSNQGHGFFSRNYFYVHGFTKNNTLLNDFYTNDIGVKKQA